MRTQCNVSYRGISSYIIAKDFKFKTLGREMVRIGFLIDLPFRIRLGELYRHQLKFRGREYDIILHNKFLIPEVTEFYPKISQAVKDESLYTDALVIVRNPQIVLETIEKLQAWTKEEGDEKLLDHVASDYYKDERNIREALNHFIIAYSMAIKDARGFRRLSDRDFLKLLRWKIAIFCPANMELTEDHYMTIFKRYKGTNILYMGEGFGEMHDVPIAETKMHIDNHLKEQEDFIHFEIAFEAKTKMLAGDYIGALLLAVAAFEGAHAAFVQNELGSRLPAEIKASTEDFLKELGMTLCNQFTPFLLLSEDERPPKELILKAGKGLKYRNEIMHSLRNRGGEYRIRNRTVGEISEAYSAVLKVYDFYVEALRKRFAKRAEQEVPVT